MLILKQLKTLQHVSTINQIIFRELVGSLLKSLSLKVFKIVKVNCGNAAAYSWCVCVAICVERYVGLQSNIPLHTECHAHTPNVMLPHHHI